MALRHRIGGAEVFTHSPVASHLLCWDQSSMLRSEVGFVVGEPRPLVGLAVELLEGLLLKMP